MTKKNLFEKKLLTVSLGLAAVMLSFGLALALTNCGGDDDDNGGGGWTAVSDITFGSSETNIRAIAYGGASGSEKFVAVGNSGKAAYCTDPSGTWTAVDLGTSAGPFYSYGSTDINGIAYGGDKFVAVGDSNGKTAYSSDGISWTAVTTTVFGESDSAGIYGIAYGGGKFVAGGYKGRAAYWVTP